MKLIFDPEALVEMREAAAFYDDCQCGLGQSFLDAVEAASAEVRPPDSKAYAFLNDSEQAISTSIMDALHSYDVNPILWSKREEVRKELSA